METEIFQMLLQRDIVLRQRSMQKSGDETILYKNSALYQSKDWRRLVQLDTYPVQRKLCHNEIVLDYDSCPETMTNVLPRWLDANGLRFEAWSSSRNGLHIHLWVTDADNKFWIAKDIARKVKQTLGLTCDFGPMQGNIIRTEGSTHPKKKYVKVQVFSNLSRLFFLNDLRPSGGHKVFNSGSTGASKSKPRAGQIPTCIKYILGHKFNDGRKRLMFTVASWYVAQGLDKKTATEKTWKWAKEQGGISWQEVYASVNSTQGRVGCTTRHQILEEIGVDMSDCKWE